MKTPTIRKPRAREGDLPSEQWRGISGTVERVTGLRLVQSRLDLERADRVAPARAPRRFGRARRPCLQLPPAPEGRAAALRVLCEKAADRPDYFEKGREDAKMSARLRALAEKANRPAPPLRREEPGTVVLPPEIHAALRNGEGLAAVDVLLLVVVLAQLQAGPLTQHARLDGRHTRRLVGARRARRSRSRRRRAPPRPLAEVVERGRLLDCRRALARRRGSRSARCSRPRSSEGGSDARQGVEQAPRPWPRCRRGARGRPRRRCRAVLRDTAEACGREVQGAPSCSTARRQRAAAWTPPPVEDLVDTKALEEDLHRVVDQINERALGDFLDEMPTCVEPKPKPAPPPQVVVAAGTKLSAEQAAEFAALVDLGHEAGGLDSGAAAPLPRGQAASY